MKLRKRIFSLVLAAAMLATAAWAGFSASAEQGGKLIALTFDDGPGEETARLLDGLKEKNVKATFFMVGSCAEQYPELVRRAYLEGHQIANHSYDHSNYLELSEQEVAQQVSRTNEILRQSGAEDFLVRAPYGDSNATVRAAAGAPMIYWSVDPLDWVYANVETVRFNIVNDAFDGAIVLLHDSHASGVDACLRAIDDLREQGYEFVTVRELFRRRGQTLNDGQEYYSRTPNGVDLGEVAAPSVTQNGNTVTLTAETGAEIYYTTDGSDPFLSGTRYTGPLELLGGTKVRAIAAFHLNGSRSQETVYTLAASPATAPLITIDEDGTVNLENRAPGASVYYTLDDTAPDATDFVYDGPFQVPTDTVVRAVATGGGYSDSLGVRAYYSPAGHFFRDVFPGSWFVPAVDRAVSLDLLSGVGIGLYSPRTSLTRAQLVTLLHRLAGSPAAEPIDVFVDVLPQKYYAEAVAWAYNTGIVKGITATQFKPKQEVTRQELAQFLAGYLEAMEIPLPQGEPLTFRDQNLISDWAKPAVDKMTAAGILSGAERNLFVPKRTTTRAQAAATLVMVYDLQLAAPQARLAEASPSPSPSVSPSPSPEDEPAPDASPSPSGEPSLAAGPSPSPEASGEEEPENDDSSSPKDSPSPEADASSPQGEPSSAGEPVEETAP